MKPKPEATMDAELQALSTIRRTLIRRTLVFRGTALWPLSCQVGFVHS